MSKYRVFLSSPGDVAAERERAETVIRRLSEEFEGIELEAVRWEADVYSASESFQDQIVAPAECDLVVSLFWSRLGTPLPSGYERPDGSERTGAEYEFEQAVAAARERHVPDIFVYRKTAEVHFSEEHVELERAEKQALEAFWTRWFRDEEGHFLAAFDTFETTDGFARKFERHLRRWIERQRETDWDVEQQGSPFRGLEAFDERHAPVFFGRRRAVEQARARLMAAAEAGTASLLVLGASGSGKSSLVRAGLIPRLQVPESTAPLIYRWRRVVITPTGLGASPIAGFARALYGDDVLPELSDGDHGDPASLAELLEAKPEAGLRPVEAALDRWARSLAAAEGYGDVPAMGLLVAVDQLEETFQLEAATRQAFHGLLEALAAHPRIWLVMTLRSDYYPALQADPSLLALKEQGRVFDLPAPTAADVREMVEGAARAAALRFEADDRRDLADMLEREATAPGALPMLQFALQSLFERRDRDTGELKLADYDTLGGAAGALATEAERLLDELGDEAKQVFPHVLRRLVDVDTAGAGEQAPQARAVMLDTFAESTPERHLVDALLESRLLIAFGGESDNAPQIRAAHESLLQRWPRAARQIAADRRDLETRARLEQAQQLWTQAGDDKERRQRLLTGLALEEGRDLDSRWGEQLPESLRTFIRASQKAAEARQRRKRLTVSGVIAALSVLTLIAGMFGTEAERNFAKTLAATDELAVQTIRDNRYDLMTTASNKLALAEKYDGAFKRLRKQTGSDTTIQKRHADLLVATSHMLFEIGRHREAGSYLDKAESVLSRLDGERSIRLEVSKQIADARARFSNGRITAALDELDHASRVLDSASAESSSAERRVLDARIALKRARYLTKRNRNARALEILKAQQEQVRQSIAAASRNDTSAISAHLWPIWVKLKYREAIAQQRATDLNSASMHENLAAVAAEVPGTPKDMLDTANALLDSGLAYVEAQEALEQTKFGEASAVVREWVDRVYRAAVKDKGNRYLQRLLVHALLRSARVAESTSNLGQARQDLDQAASIIDGLLEYGDPSPATTELVYRRLGRQASIVSTQNEGDTEALVDDLRKLLDRLEQRRDAANSAFAASGRYLLPFTVNNIMDALDVMGAERETRLELGLRSIAIIEAISRGSSKPPEPAEQYLNLWYKVLQAAHNNESKPGAGEVLEHRQPQLHRYPDEVRARNAHNVMLVANALAGHFLDVEQPDRARKHILMALESALNGLEQRDRDSFLLGNIFFVIDKLLRIGFDEDRGLATEGERLRELVSALRAIEPSGKREAAHAVDSLEYLIDKVEKRYEMGGARNGGTAVSDLLDTLETLHLKLESHVPNENAANDSRDEGNMSIPRYTQLRIVERSAETVKTKHGGEYRKTGEDVSWSSPPLLAGNWRTMVEKEARGVIEKIRDVGDGVVRRSLTDKSIRRVRMLDLPFYREGRLVEVDARTSSGGYEMLTYLVVGDALYRLQGTSPPIHEANADAPVELDTSEQVTSYIRFFTSYVAGDAGSFMIVEDPNDLRWRRPPRPKEERAIAEVLRPLVVWPADTGEAAWRATATVHYGEYLFWAQFAIHASGRIEMVKDFPVAGGFPLAEPLLSSRARRRNVTAPLDLLAIGVE